jgi:hypothetical protein
MMREDRGVFVRDVDIKARMAYDLVHGFPKHCTVPLPNSTRLRATVLRADISLPSSCYSQVRAACALEIEFVTLSERKAVEGKRISSRRDLQRGYSLNGGEISHNQLLLLRMLQII